VQSYQEKITSEVLVYFQRRAFYHEERVEDGCRSFVVKSGKDSCYLKVYDTGRVLVQGAESNLRTELLNLKSALESGGDVGVLLAEDINQLGGKVLTLTGDVVVAEYVAEAVRCLGARALVACTFLLGAASEKAIWHLFDSYTQAITDPGKQQAFATRIKDKKLLAAYKEFKDSFISCNYRPSNPALSTDLEGQLDSLFNHYRISRNQVGHPKVPPTQEEWQVKLSVSTFYQYLHTIYALAEEFGLNAPSPAR